MPRSTGINMAALKVMHGTFSTTTLTAPSRMQGPAHDGDSGPRHDMPG